MSLTKRNGKLWLQVTPYDAASGISPCWLNYVDDMDQLSDSELSVSTFIGLPENYIMRRASCPYTTRKTVSWRWLFFRIKIKSLLYWQCNAETFDEW